MGSRLKHEIKSLTYHEVGVKMDDALEQAKAELAKQKGGNEAFVSAMKAVEDLAAHADKESRDGAFDLEALKHVKRYLVRAVEVLRNLGLQAEVTSYVARGKIQAFEKAVGLTKALYDGEKQAILAIEAAEKRLAEAGTVQEEGAEREAPGRRMPGVHPGNLSGDRKEAEEAAKGLGSAVAEASSESAPAPPVEMPPVEMPPVEMPPAPVAPPHVEEMAADDPLDVLDALTAMGGSEPPAESEAPAPPTTRKGRKKVV